MKDPRTPHAREGKKPPIPEIPRSAFLFSTINNGTLGSGRASLDKPRVPKQAITRGGIAQNICRKARMDHKGTSPIQNVLNGTLGHPIGLRHSGLGKLVPTPES